MEKVSTCWPPAQGHRPDKVWSQPSLPGNPAAHPTMLSSHQTLRLEGEAPSCHFTGRESSEEWRDGPESSVLVQDRAGLSPPSWPLVMWKLCVLLCDIDTSKRECVCAQTRGMWTLRPSSLKFGAQDYITLENICSWAGGCEFFFIMNHILNPRRAI